MSTRPKPSQGEVCTAQQHGTSSAYDWWGCRCPQAREEFRLHRKRKREGRLPDTFVPAVGTARRLRALVAAGWSWRALAGRLGVTASRPRRWAESLDGVVRRETAEKVDALFREIAMVPGGSRYALTVARKYGWQPPLAWLDIDDPAEQPDRGGYGVDIVDEVAVERALSGEPIDLTDAELVAAVQAGAARDVPITAVAELLGINALSAKRMLAGELPPAMEKRRRIELELLAHPGESDADIARRLGVQASTVSAARCRIAGMSTEKSA